MGYQSLDFLYIFLLQVTKQEETRAVSSAAPHSYSHRPADPQRDQRPRVRNILHIWQREDCRVSHGPTASAPGSGLCLCGVY